MQNAAQNEPGGGIQALAEACAATRGGDRGAFEALHARLGPAVRGFFGKRLGPLGGADLADDLSQRVWTGLWEAFSQGRYDPSRSSITTFVYAIAAKTWLRHLRSTRRSGAGGAENTVAPEDLEALGLGSGDTDADAAGGAELLEAVRRCLRERDTPGALTDEEHAIVVASAEGASDRALAERFGLAASTINAKKRSGWEKVRRALARLGHRVENPERPGPEREQQGSGGG